MAPPSSCFAPAGIAQLCNDVKMRWAIGLYSRLVRSASPKSSKFEVSEIPRDLDPYRGWRLSDVASSPHA